MHTGSRKTSEQQLDVNSAWMTGTDRCASTGYIHSKRLEQKMEKKLEAAHTAHFGTPKSQETQQ